MRLDHLLSMENRTDKTVQIIQGQSDRNVTTESEPFGSRCLIFEVRMNLERLGGIAQLGEHLLCKQGVIGSIPIISTKWAYSSAG